MPSSLHLHSGSWCGQVLYASAFGKIRIFTGECCYGSETGENCLKLGNLGLMNYFSA